MRSVTKSLGLTSVEKRDVRVGSVCKWAQGWERGCYSTLDKTSTKGLGQTRVSIMYANVYNVLYRNSAMTLTVLVLNSVGAACTERDASASSEPAVPAVPDSRDDEKLRRARKGGMAGNPEGSSSDQ